MEQTYPCWCLQGGLAVVDVVAGVAGGFEVVDFVVAVGIVVGVIVVPVSCIVFGLCVVFGFSVVVTVDVSIVPGALVVGLEDSSSLFPLP